MTPRDSRRAQLSLHLTEGHKAQSAAILAVTLGDWCRAEACLTEAQIHLRWAKRHARILCDHYAGKL